MLIVLATVTTAEGRLPRVLRPLTTDTALTTKSIYYLTRSEQLFDKTRWRRSVTATTKISINCLQLIIIFYS